MGDDGGRRRCNDVPSPLKEDGREFEQTLIPGKEAKIVDVVSGKELGAGERGELLIKGDIFQSLQANSSPEGKDGIL